MKVTKEERDLILQTHKKYVNESNFVGKLFKYLLSKKISKDPNIKNAIKDAEENLEKIRKNVEKKASKEDIKDAIPPNVRKYLGFKY
jgi:phosphoenolpyruvate-protein kinase (PTS system EI component)